MGVASQFDSIALASCATTAAVALCSGVELELSAPRVGMAVEYASALATDSIAAAGEGRRASNACSGPVLLAGSVAVSSGTDVSAAAGSGK